MSMTEPSLNGHAFQYNARLALPLASLEESRPPRLLGLTLQPLADTAVFEEDEALDVREFRRDKDVFTPHMSGTLQCPGLLVERTGSFQKHYLLPCGGLRDDVRVQEQAILVAFTPVLDWASRRVALMVTPLVWNRVPAFDRLRALATTDPHLKAYVRWKPTRKKYVVGHQPLSPDERAVVEAVVWPEAAALEEALASYTVDTLDRLLADYPDLAMRFLAKEEE